MDKINLEKLKAANLPVCDFEDLGLKFEVNGKVSDPSVENAIKHYKSEIRKRINEYLKTFVKPVVSLDKKGNFQFYRCISCDCVLSGLFGTFEWGIAHGEGYCSKCGYPARAFHKIDEPGWKMTFSNILQYHPKFLERKVNDDAN